MAMNAQDLLAIQECMNGYRQLVNWVPAQSQQEAVLKEQRLEVINHISAVCDQELTRLSEEYRNE